MTTADTIRTAARRQLRDAVLDAAQQVVIADGWHRVRMGAVATAVGVSRQTLHAEFGTRDALGQALVLRETARFLDGVAAVLAQHPNRLHDAVRAAVAWVLTTAGEDPLLRTVLTSARGGDDSLLPLLTTRSEPVLHAATTALREFTAARHPELDPERVAAVMDALARLVVSHLVLPVDPVEVTAARLARLAHDSLRLPG